MENASKALLMAGGILIALLILVLLVYSFGTMSGFFNSEEKKEEAEQLKLFNDQYEAYNRKLLRGTDIVSVMNKVLSNNKKYGPDGYDEPNYMMNMEFVMVEELAYEENGNAEEFFKTGDNNPYNLENFTEIKNDSEAFTDFKRRIFDCVEVKYNKETGRVNYMKFKERKLDNYGEGF